MNQHPIGSGIEEAAFQAWDREERSKKRRAALVVAVALMVGFLGAAVAGRVYGPQATSAHAANVAPR